MVFNVNFIRKIAATNNKLGVAQIALLPGRILSFFLFIINAMVFISHSFSTSFHRQHHQTHPFHIKLANWHIIKTLYTVWSTFIKGYAVV